jgi:hypothetical protein
MDQLSSNVREESSNGAGPSGTSPPVVKPTRSRFPCPPLSDISFNGTYPFLCIKGINDHRTPEKEAMRAALRMPQSQWFPLDNMDNFLKVKTDPFPPPVVQAAAMLKIFSFCIYLYWLF